MIEVIATTEAAPKAVPPVAAAYHEMVAPAVPVATRSAIVALLQKFCVAAAVGAAGGAAVGGVIGRASGNTALGAIIGATVGGVTGAVIGRKMDKQAKEIENEVPGAKVERVGEGIVVDFEEKILFGSVTVYAGY